MYLIYYKRYVDDIFALFNKQEHAQFFLDSMVRKLNRFLLTRKLNHKCLVKVRPFSSAKVRHMHDHL